MKTLATVVYCLFVLIELTVLPGCTRKKQPQPDVPSLTIADKMAGTRTWHGNHCFDGINAPIGTNTMTIVKITDSIVMCSNDYTLRLTYSGTDPAKGCATFILKGGPRSLYYFYKGDSMRYNIDNGGIHNEHTDLHTP